MLDLERDQVRAFVEEALEKIPKNRLGLHLAKNGIFRLNDRWWAALEPTTDPDSSSELWDAIVDVEEKLDEISGDGIKVQVTAA